MSTTWAGRTCGSLRWSRRPQRSTPSSDGTSLTSTRRWTSSERPHVVFTSYDELAQDEHDAWTAPDGTRVAWFVDPDGNVLSLAQHA